MFAYVARQAITDRNKRVQGYELLFRDGVANCFPDIQPDEATSKLLTGSHLSLGVEDITSGKTAFINFHQETLQHKFPTSLNPAKVVVEVVETVEPNEALVEACKHIGSMGYKLALDDFDFSPKWRPLLPFVTWLKVDIEQVNVDQYASKIKALKEQGFKLIAERVETQTQFEQCHELGFDCFQGYYFAKPELTRQRTIPSCEFARLELIKATGAKEFNFTLINQILERDISLSYMLLRFINNPTVNKRNTITSLQHALNYMGEMEIRKFVALVAMANLGDDKPPELLRMSLIRAKFCEQMTSHNKEYNNPPTGYLLGMFSMLDVILEQPMSALVNKLPLDKTLTAALSGEANRLKDYLNLVVGFEQADWHTVNQLTASLGLDHSLVTTFYENAIGWSSAMLGAVQQAPAA